MKQKKFSLNITEKNKQELLKQMDDYYSKNESPLSNFFKSQIAKIPNVVIKFKKLVKDGWDKNEG